MIAIFAPTPTPRIRYAVDLIFGVLLGTAHRILSDESEFEAFEGFKINYTDIALRADITWKPHPLMSASDIKPVEVAIGEWNGLPTVFPQEAKHCPFDLLAAVFYLAARYEEYLPHEADKHGRFPAEASVAAQYDFLERPLIDEWVQRLRWHILKVRPDTRFADRKFSAEATFDIDVAWAYRHKGWWRTLGGFVLDAVYLKFGQWSRRWGAVLGTATDPYDTYYYIRELCDYHRVGARYFFLLGDYSGYDRNSSHRLPAMRHLIHDCAQHGPVGIHPSYGSHESTQRLSREIERLADITGGDVQHSRQHYLKMTLPETYRRLMASGIRHDYTMGYAQRAGFRASLATPFPFFDLAQNVQTELWIHPFAYMDGTLRQYMQLEVPEARKKAEALIGAVRNVNGVFSCLWHNSSLTDRGEWTGWRSVFEHTLACCSERIGA